MGKRGPRAQKPASLFFKHVKKTKGCDFWTGAKQINGYGEFWFNGKLMRAHRVAWILHYGPIPKGLEVLHNCPGGDNRLCVKPKHLWLGTQQDNIKDAFRKGRVKMPLPPKLTEQQAQEIRDSVGISQAKLANLYNISQTQIHRIKAGENRI